MLIIDRMVQHILSHAPFIWRFQGWQLSCHLASITNAMSDSLSNFSPEVQHSFDFRFSSCAQESKNTLVLNSQSVEKHDESRMKIASKQRREYYSIKVNRKKIKIKANYTNGKLSKVYKLREFSILTGP